MAPIMTESTEGPAFFLTDRDKMVLSQTDEEYELITWERLKTIIAKNRLQDLTRLPSQLRLYLEWTKATKEEYGTMTNFLLKQRLFWEPVPSSDPDASPTFAYKDATPFVERSDYRILVNDWPYGFSPGIKHICVWLKSRLPLNEETGDLTDEGREMIMQFVQKTFTKGLGLEGQDKVQWFKNWTGIQSIRALEHIHVLVRDVDPEVLGTIIEWPS